MKVEKFTLKTLVENEKKQKKAVVSAKKLSPENKEEVIHHIKTQLQNFHETDIRRPFAEAWLDFLKDTTSSDRSLMRAWANCASKSKQMAGRFIPLTRKQADKAGCSLAFARAFISALASNPSLGRFKEVEEPILCQE